MTESSSRHLTDETLVSQVLQGNVRAAGRLMRRVDDDRPEARAMLAELFAHTGKAHIVGITGNPGAGKSTLVNALIAEFRRRDLTIGCIAVDPTSPFSGGAILGDRVRMQEHALDPGVFIRSVATRGNLGGISRSTPAIVQILDAMGFDLIVIETVGVGQDEIDIVRLADTSVVLNVPGLGDEVQASKAGLLEIADVLVINKADRDGMRRLRRELRAMVELGEFTPNDWKPPVLETIATKPQGVIELADVIFSHHEWIVEHGQAELIERERLNHYVWLLALGELERAMREQCRTESWHKVLVDLSRRQGSPSEAAQKLLKRLREERDVGH